VARVETRLLIAGEQVADLGAALAGGHPGARARRAAARGGGPPARGEAIVADARVDCVAFTGSVETGKTIAPLQEPPRSGD